MAEKIRCAIYTRKSTEEGLDQEFNSLDAQREAAEAFIKSQRHLRHRNAARATGAAGRQRGKQFMIHEDRTINGTRYRVIADVRSIAAPNGTLLVYILSNATKIHDRLAGPGDTEDSLLEEGWRIAGDHACKP
jgi:hypothetical protein